MPSIDYLLIFQGPSIVLLLDAICILLLSSYKILISFEENVLFIMIILFLKAKVVLTSQKNQSV